MERVFLLRFNVGNVLAVKGGKRVSGRSSNTKELVGDKYGTPAPVPFKVVDEDIGFKTNIGIKCFGEYSYRIVNPLLFYTSLCGKNEKEN